MYSVDMRSAARQAVSAGEQNKYVIRVYFSVFR